MSNSSSEQDSIFEIVELVNNEMEAESGFQFPHALDCVVEVDEDGAATLTWRLVNNLSGDLFEIVAEKVDKGYQEIR